MLVILEGPDGGGKSTIAAKLRPFNIIHHGPYVGEENIYHHYFESLMEAARDQHRGTIIFDRSWLSEPIYGNVIRGYDRLGTKARMLDRIALGLGAVAVLCLPPIDRVLSTVAHRQQDEYVKKIQQMEDIYEGYRGGLDTSIPTVTYDFTKQKLITLGYKIKGAQKPNLGPGIGMWHPGRSILLVGEQRGEDDGSPDPHGNFEWPFVSDQGCSPWFTAQLEKFGVSEKDLYWVNALDRQGNELELDFVQRLAPRMIIALGKVADGLLTRHRIAHVAVDHPQYWKRFHYSQPWYALRNALKGEV